MKVAVAEIGNPHAVLRVPNVEEAAVDEVGGQVSRHRQFPKQANVGFMQIVAGDLIRLRVYERGVGETYACGSGACAAVAVGVANGWLENQVRVELPGGTALVEWPRSNRLTPRGDEPMLLTGPVHSVFGGEIEL